MSPRGWLKTLAGVWLVALVAACSSMPTQEMSDARQAIEAARDAGAETLAAFSFDSATRRLHLAESALQLGKYEDSRAQALAAKEAAVKAREIALAIKGTTDGTSND